MLPVIFLTLCAAAVAAPVPNPERAVPFIDINASNNNLDVPVNVFGLQTHDISAFNGNLSPNQAAPNQAVPNQASAPVAQASTPASKSPAPVAATSSNGITVNGNKVNVPVNILGVQSHDISAVNGNESPNQAATPNQAAVPAAQLAKAEAGSTNGSHVAPTAVNVSPATGAAPNAPMGAIGYFTSALYNFASGITSVIGGRA